MSSNGTQNNPYQSGPASSFVTPSRTPIYAGQSCYFCGKKEGDLIFAGYDEVFGESWFHPACQKQEQEAIAKSKEAHHVG